jgi:hypothetical protein
VSGRKPIVSKNARVPSDPDREGVRPSTRFSRSANLASAFRSDPCTFTAHSYSVPNVFRRPAVVLLRFRKYSQPSTASAAMIRIAAAASTIRFVSMQMQIHRNLPASGMPTTPSGSRSSLWRQNLLSCQYRTPGSQKLVSIDRFIESAFQHPGKAEGRTPRK